MISFKAGVGTCVRGVLVLSFGFLWSCDERLESPLVPVTAPSASIADGASGAGSAALLFLRPVAPRQPSVTASLNDALLPHLSIEVCALVDGACGPLVRAAFTAQDQGSERLRIVDDELRHFQVNWHTRRHHVSGASHYRITVKLAAQTLGYADAYVASSAGELAEVDRSSYVPVRFGSTLPISFHVSDAAQVIGPGGGTAIFAGGAVALSIPAGVLSGPTGFTAAPVADPPSGGGVSLAGGAVYDMGPHGFVFPAPVELTIAYDEAQLPPGLSEHQLALLHYVDGAWESVPGSSVNTVANTVTGSVTSFSPLAPGGGSIINLTGNGTATLDGVVGPAEWAGAGCDVFNATLPGGGTTPATVCVMNDATNLYVSVRYSESTVVGDNMMDLSLDNLDDGRNVGDDVVTSQASIVGGSLLYFFIDAFLNNSPGCPSSDGLCPTLDADDGGTTDGGGAFANTAGVSAHEISHPLNTTDDTHDFSVGPGSTVGLELFLIIGGAGGGTLYAPLDHVHVLIQSTTGPVVDQQQATIDVSVGGLAIGSGSEQILAQVVTAGISGEIAEVRFPVACDSGDLIVEIQGVTATGEPDGLVLASETTPSASLPSFAPAPPSFRAVVFSTPTTVTVGDRFSIVLKNPTGACGVFQGPVGDPYAGGDGFFDSRPNAAGVWVLLGARADLAFQTFVR